jgi:hypothetical protein
VSTSIYIYRSFIPAHDYIKCLARLRSVYDVEIRGLRPLIGLVSPGTEP